MNSANPRPEPIKPNAPIGESYIVVRMLRETPTGRVYLCKHSALTLNQFAVTVYYPDIANSKKDAARIAEVCQIFPQVIQPNVCRVYEIVDHEGSIALCSEYTDAFSLSAVVSDVTLSLRDAFRMLYSVGEGIRAIHALGVAHGNITGRSILVPESQEPMITDPLIATADLLYGPGEPKELAPEQWWGEPPTTASDLFCFGAVAYRLLTGEPVYAGMTVEDLQQHPQRLNPRPVDELRAECPPEIAQLVMQLLAPLARDRPVGIATILDAIREWEIRGEVNLSVPAPAPVTPAAATTELPSRRYDAEPPPVFQGRKLLSPPPTTSGWERLGQRWRLVVGSTVFRRLGMLCVGTVLVAGLLMGVRALRGMRSPLATFQQTATADNRNKSLKPLRTKKEPAEVAPDPEEAEDEEFEEISELPAPADQTTVQIVGAPSSLPAGPADRVTIILSVRNTGAHDARNVEVSVLTGSGRTTPIDGPRTLKAGDTQQYTGRTRETMAEIESQRIAFVVTCANCPNHGK